MAEIRTSLGEVYELERRLPSLGWKPRRRGVGDWTDALDVPDFGDADDLGILAVIGIVIFAIVAILILIPLLLFVAEVALVVALIIPLTIFALALGLKQHTVLLTRKADGKVVDTRSVHGVLGTVRAGRELRSAANAGAYRS
ncbi:MAG: hypothetical protein AAGC46_04835 [Solirubrobacteraceae bacterium]|nr:hypothetical protein [Patulibacter sp.]